MLYIKRNNENAVIPKRQNEGDAGYDLYSVEENIIHPFERKLIGTGLHTSFDSNYEIQIRPRSGLAYKNGITVLNTPGTIDSKYTGELKVLLINFSQTPFVVKKGDRIAQMIINKVEHPIIKEVSDLDDTKRGSGGFGSTGV